MSFLIRISFIMLFVTKELMAQSFTTPIHSTNQYINQVIMYRPYTSAAVIQEQEDVTMSISQSNVFQKSTNLTADFGLTTFDLTYSTPVTRSFAFSFEFPLYYVSRGFLDKPLDFVHKGLGITTTRENEGHVDDQMTYTITDKIEKYDPYFAAGNPQIEIKYLLYSDAKLSFAMNAGIKLPLEKTSDGFTNGRVDYMYGLALQREYDSIAWITNVVITYNGERRLSPDIVSKQIRYFFFLANQFSLKPLLPFAFFDRWKFLFAYQYSSAPYASQDKKFSSYTHLLQFALRNYLESKRYVELFFNQNTIPRHNEADVTFGLSYHF